MKTAIYIEDGLTQFVLTPESEIDKKILVALQSTDLKTYRGNFYACMGGWTRQDPNHWDRLEGLRNPFLNSESCDDESLIFVINKTTGQVDKQPKPVEEQGPDGCKYHTS